MTLRSRCPRVSLFVLAACAAFSGAAPRGASADNLLLIPDISGTATGRRVLAFNPFDGSLVNPNFISPAAGLGYLQSPKDVVDSGRGTLLISDQLANAIYEYSDSGIYLRTITNQAASGVQNLRGLTVHNGNIYVTVGAGTYTDTVQEFSLDGTRIGTFASNHVSSPYAITFRANDVLISNTGSKSNADANTVARFDLSGNYLNTPITSIAFPQQIAPEANGNLLIPNFTNPSNINEYDALGSQINKFSNISVGIRGAYALGNGKIMYTAGNNIGVFDRVTGLATTVYSGGNFNYIESVNVTATPEPGTLTLFAAGALTASGFLLRRKRK